jgi:hypothetical protein
LQRQQDRKGKENSIGNQNKASGEKVERLRITRESDYGKKIAEGDRRPLYAAIRLQQAHDWGTKVATTHTLWRKHYLEYNNCGAVSVGRLAPPFFFPSGAKGSSRAIFTAQASCSPY